MSESICRLCNINEADKKNSHIIPKFLCKSLFALVEPRHTLQIHKSGEEKRIQDTPKENNILCTICEKRIEIIETSFAKKINEIHLYKTYPEKFKHNINGQKEILECKNIHPTFFKLFIYSLVWRCSISNLYEFQKFKLSQIVEEDLRSFLDKNLNGSHSILVNSIEAISEIPFYHICMIKPKLKTVPSGGMLSAFSFNTKSHLLMLVDFLIFFIIDDKTIVPALKEFSNKQNQRVIIGLTDNGLWFEFNKDLLFKMQNLNE